MQLTACAWKDVYICTIKADQQDGMSFCPHAPCATDGFNYCLREGSNPFWGSIHFDNIFGAWVVLFQCITQEAWVDIMYLVMVRRDRSLSTL